MNSKPKDSPLTTSWLNEDNAAPLHPKKFLVVEDRDSQCLNISAQFNFGEIVEGTIEHFFKEADLIINGLYANYAYEKDAEFLLKHLYFKTLELAKKSNQKQYHDHKDEIDVKVEAPAKYDGFSIQQLIDEGELVFKDPKKKSINSSTREAEIFGVLPSLLKSAYFGRDNRPRSNYPGYRENLNDRVKHLAKEFMGDFYDNKLEREEEILAASKIIADKQQEILPIIAKFREAYEIAYGQKI